MKRVMLVLAILGCDAGTKPAPKPAPPVMVARPVSIDASVGSDASDIAEAPPVVAPPALGPRASGAQPCSAADLGATGQPLAARVLPDCELLWDPINRIEAQARSARGGMRDTNGPIKPPKEHVIGAAKNGQLQAIEATSAKELARLVRCAQPPKIDWNREHVWVVTFEAEDGSVRVGSVIDDGKTAVVGLSTTGRGCRGAAPESERDGTLVVVPAVRAVAIAECTSTEPPEHCTGMEK